MIDAFLPKLKLQQLDLFNYKFVFLRVYLNYQHTEHYTVLI